MLSLMGWDEMRPDGIGSYSMEKQNILGTHLLYSTLILTLDQYDIFTAEVPQRPTHSLTY